MLGTTRGPDAARSQAFLALNRGGQVSCLTPYPTFLSNPSLTLALLALVSPHWVKHSHTYKNALCPNMLKNCAICRRTTAQTTIALLTGPPYVDRA